MSARTTDSPGGGRLLIRQFRGVDLTNQPANVDPTRSFCGDNMIRDVPGKVKKRKGYEILRTYPARINGVFSLGGWRVVHSGNELYLDGDNPQRIYEGAADALSHAIELGGKLWFADGKRLLAIGAFEDGDYVKPVSAIAFVPTISIGRAPGGGGTTFEPVNMLSDSRTDSFLGAAGTTVYQLSFKALSAAAVTAKVLDANGNWQTWAEGVHFSVNRAAGLVTFGAAPGASPVTGEDNVTITYAVENSAYKSRVNGCTTGICYGIGGATDRLFLGGNDNYPNQDYFCAIGDPTYWGDIWYGVIGRDASPIMGYSIIGDQLATHKRGDDEARNIVLRRGALGDDGAAQFPITGVIQGAGAVSRYSFGFLSEPLFLCADGICATTPYEYSAERYIQNRSFYINAALNAEPGHAEAYAAVWGDFYALALGGKIYLLDTLVRAAGHTRSEYQYEAYVWTNIGARVLHADNGRLLFGGEDGRLCGFFTGDTLACYADAAVPGDPRSGKAIHARWDIDFSGAVFYAKKRLQYIAVKMATAPATSVHVSALVRGERRTIMEPNARASYFQYANLRYSRFTYSGAVQPRVVAKRVRIRKIDSARFSFSNSEKNEPFGLHEIALAFVESGQFRY